MTSALLLCVLATALLPSEKSLSASPGPPPSVDTVLGVWHAALEPTPEYPVLFDIRVEHAKGKGGALAAWLVNGAVEVPFSAATWDGATLTLELSHYDAKLVAERRGPELAGRYLRTLVHGVADVPFRASRKAPPLPAAPPEGKSIAGAWGLEVGTAPGKVDRLTGVFSQKGAALSGTLLSITGDYGALHGWTDGETLVLTLFDGVNVYRYDGELLPDGTLVGEYRTRTNPPVAWRAKRLAGAEAEQ